MPSLRSALAIAMSAAALLVASDAAAAGTTTVFPYRQRTLLYSRDPAGALVHVTSGAKPSDTLPVVVFLHGMNRDRILHSWFGPPQGDLRGVVEPLVQSGRVAPFILAAPTHTRNATGATAMWPDFDLGDFLDATEAALAGSAHVDRSRVIVLGHSGAGCNPGGGLLGDGVLRARPLAVVAIDTCVDERVMPRLTSLAETANVRFYWHRSWRRPVADLAGSCASCTIEEVVDLPPRAIPHLAMVPAVVRRALPELLPPQGTTTPSAAQDPAQGTTRWMTTGSPSTPPTRT